MAISWDRVIRTTVGLRPFRPAGFVLRAERTGDKLLVHNYGHGGAGWSLSWGTAELAADLARDHEAKDVAVLGCGVIGLTMARVLQRRGYGVTVYAAEVPPRTTSNMALAGFTPTSGLVEFSRRTPEWEAQFRTAVDIAYRQWQLLASPMTGVSWIDNYVMTEDAPAAGGTNALLPEHIRGERELLQPGEHPFPTTYAIRRRELRFEPSFVLDALLRDVMLFGGHLTIQRLASAEEIHARVRESIVVNCTGLGSRELFGDQELVPLKGQLTVLAPQPEIQYSTSGGYGVQPNSPDGFLHTMPRNDGLVLGGTSERDVWSLEPSEEHRKRVVEQHIALFAAMRSPDARGAT